MRDVAVPVRPWKAHGTTVHAAAAAEQGRRGARSFWRAPGMIECTSPAHPVQRGGVYRPVRAPVSCVPCLAVVERRGIRLMLPAREPVLFSAWPALTAKGVIHWMHTRPTPALLTLELRRQVGDLMCARRAPHELAPLPSLEPVTCPPCRAMAAGVGVAPVPYTTAPDVPVCGEPACLWAGRICPDHSRAELAAVQVATDHAIALDRLIQAERARLASAGPAGTTIVLGGVAAIG